MREFRHDWLAVGGWRSEWLVLERPDGVLEDKGYVEIRRYVPLLRQGDEAPSGKRQLLQWREPGAAKGRGVTLFEEDYDEAAGGWRNPYAVDMCDGTREYWHLGEAAHRKMRKAGRIADADGKVEMRFVGTIG